MRHTRKRHRWLIEVLEPRQLMSGVMVSDASAAESAGAIVFHVTLDTPAKRETTVRYTTEAIDATPGKDYVAKAGKVMIAAGGSTADISIGVKNDAMWEGGETFRLNLEIGGAKYSVVGTIQDDDSSPTLLTKDVKVVEGNDGRRYAVVRARLSEPAGVEMGFPYATSDTTPYHAAATAGADYVETKGTLVFAPGQRVAEVRVPVLGDRVAEEDETFAVTFGPFLKVAGQTDPVAYVTIKDDDKAPKGGEPLITLGDGSGAEGDSGTSTGTLTVVLSKKTDHAVTFRYSYGGKKNGAAALSSQKSAVRRTGGKVTIPAGQTSVMIPVVYEGDTNYEGNEVVRVNLTEIKGARPVNGRRAVGGAFTVVDDEPVIFTDVSGVGVLGYSGMLRLSDHLVSTYASSVPVMYSSQVLLGGGSLSVATTRFATSEVAVAGTNAFVFTGSLTAQATAYLGAGTLTLSGSAVIDHVTTLNSGTLILANSGAATIGSTAGMSVSGAGRLTLSSGSSYQGSGGLTLNIGGSGVVGTVGGSSYNVVVVGSNSGSYWSANTTVLDSSTTFWGWPFFTTSRLDLVGYAATFQTSLSASSVIERVESGFAGGVWTGSGIVSRKATDDAEHRTGVGYVTQEDGSVLVKAALYGDANLDGVVDEADVATVQQAMSGEWAPASWSRGDFNYDHVIDGDDLAMMDRNMGRTIG